MSEANSHAGSKKTIHWLTIQRVTPSRLRVISDDNQIGIIPEREWSWDRRIQRELPVFIEGQRIEAVLIEEKVGLDWHILALQN